MTIFTEATPKARPSRPDRALNVCHLAYTFFESDNRVLRYAQALTGRGDSVDVVALRRSGQSRRGVFRGIDVLRIQRRAINEKHPVTYLLKLLWFLATSSIVLAVRQFQRRYDLVHVHNVPDFLVFAAIIPKLFGSKVVLDIHDALPELYAEKFGVSKDAVVFRALTLVEQLSCRFADHVIIANHIWNRRLVERGVPSEKTTTILNYPDLKIFTPRPGPRHNAGAAFTMIYPGTLNRHQGLDVAVRAFARIKDRIPGAEFHIYGEGTARDTLHGLIAKNGLQNRVKLLGRLPIDQVAKAMAEADLGIEPKLADGFANEALSTKILEFMACDVPVLVSRTAVHRYYFDESLVQFFTPGDVEELAAAMLWAYENRADPSSRTARAKDFAADYAWHTRVDDYYGVVDALVTDTAHAKVAIP